MSDIPNDVQRTSQASSLISYSNSSKSILGGGAPTIITNITMENFEIGGELPYADKYNAN